MWHQAKAEESEIETTSTPKPPLNFQNKLAQRSMYKAHAPSLVQGNIWRSHDAYSACNGSERHQFPIVTVEAFSTTQHATGWGLDSCRCRYSPWQRGSNENINGLIRQFLPKGMDLSQVSQRMLNRISLLLNIRPRAVLNFQNPLEVYSQMIQKIQNAQTLPTVALDS